MRQLKAVRAHAGRVQCGSLAMRKCLAGYHVRNPYNKPAHNTVHLVYIQANIRICCYSCMCTIYIYICIYTYFAYLFARREIKNRICIRLYISVHLFSAELLAAYCPMYTLLTCIYLHTCIHVYVHVRSGARTHTRTHARSLAHESTCTCILGLTQMSMHASCKQRHE